MSVESNFESPAALLAASFFFSSSYPKGLSGTHKNIGSDMKMEAMAAESDTVCQLPAAPNPSTEKPHPCLMMGPRKARALASPSSGAHPTIARRRPSMCGGIQLEAHTMMATHDKPSAKKPLPSHNVQNTMKRFFTPSASQILSPKLQRITTGM